MKNLNITAGFTAIAGLIASALLTGCHTAPIAHGEVMYKNDDTTCVGRMSQAQAANGAKNDAMLYDHNFHGSELNSLGQVKLDLILKATPSGDPVYVYLNMTHDQVAARQAAVTAYLKTAGLADTKIIVAEGANPNPSTPTAYNMSGLYKKDGQVYAGEAFKDEPIVAPTSGSGH
jgi:hypothetical protein